MTGISGSESFILQFNGLSESSTIYYFCISHSSMNSTLNLIYKYNYTFNLPSEFKNNVISSHGFKFFIQLRAKDITGNEYENYFTQSDSNHDKYDLFKHKYIINSVENILPSFYYISYVHPNYEASIFNYNVHNDLNNIGSINNFLYSTIDGNNNH